MEANTKIEKDGKTARRGEQKYLMFSKLRNKKEYKSRD